MGYRTITVDGTKYRYLVGSSYVNIRRVDNQVSENIPRHQVEEYDDCYESVSVKPGAISGWVRENLGSFER